jgi:predicted transcriptional regulator
MPGSSRAKKVVTTMDRSNRRKQCFVLRLPDSLREQAIQLAKEEGTSLNYFIGIALAEKLTRMQQHQARVASRQAEMGHFRAGLRPTPTGEPLNAPLQAKNQ